VNKPKIAIAITGASGSIYAKVLLEKLVTLKDSVQEVVLVMSDNARDVWQQELGNKNYEQLPFKLYSKNDFFSPIASGSAGFHALIVCPCSMGTMARIAGGISNDLVTRAADVMLKERRKLILVTRESPLNLIQIRNMQTITEAGGIICPASPSFYSLPKTFDELAATVTDRVLDLVGIEHKTYRWGK
jgi:4-hydroxy-3-polyprenylbenzoate decarboxylase